MYLLILFLPSSKGISFQWFHHLSTFKGGFFDFKTHIITGTSLYLTQQLPFLPMHVFTSCISTTAGVATPFMAVQSAADMVLDV